MITKIPANKRFLAEHGWLKSYHLFSFADYYDPHNMNFGSLRVFNDDWIDAHSGFSDHPHSNMEIVTIVLEGEITHKDSMGNQGIIHAGEVQHMSAGTGVVHAEMNLSDKPVSLYQIWLQPKEQNILPSYSQKDFSHISNLNHLCAVASGENKNDSLYMHTHGTIYTCTLEESKSLTHDTPEHFGVFVYTSSGILIVNNELLQAHDQARITKEPSLTLTAKQTTNFVLIEVPV